ncbi:uncharacterized protein LOC110092150 [Dendrobium catenatum]|uniref:uncharacterized protein LOC110092150 n=1 Tax=Dendrobium catenatum TaxID=906689 RepID=UPI0009F29056|nr:uncharacterized protein LOC110092150 [Dendrobium catenatum]
MGNNTELLQQLLHKLKTVFSLKQLGNISTFLGIQFSKTADGYFLHQTHYLKEILHQSGFTDCKSAPTPITIRSNAPQLTDSPFHDPTLFRKLVGSLQYLTITRPDIAFTVNHSCQRMHSPTIKDFQALKRILRYLQGTSTYGLPVVRGLLSLSTYVDADWAADQHDQKSVTCFCTFLGPNLISWCVKKQPTVAKSSTEAEYRALASATSDVIWLRRLLGELNAPQTTATRIFCDNTSAMALAHNPIFHARTKHIEIDHHFINQHIQSNAIQLLHISSAEQPADLLTKPLPITRFHDLCSKLTIRSQDCSFEGGC